MSERTIGENYIKDIEKARAGADAQKPARDIARQKEVEVTDEKKIMLDDLAERLGEKAEQKYEEEKEQNPVERLLKNIDKIGAKMREKGLEPDAIIVEKLKDRFNRYVDSMRKAKAAYEKGNNKRASFRDIQDYIAWSIPVTYNDQKGDGAVYGSDGKRIEEHYGKDIGKVRKLIKKGKRRDGEIIDFDFSEQGKTEFLRDMGVLKDSEEIIDIPTVFGKQRGGFVNPQDFDALFPIDIEGVKLRIEKKRSPENRLPRLPEKDIISLIFDGPFLERLFSSL